MTWTSEQLARERARHLEERVRELYELLGKRDKRIADLESVVSHDAVTIRDECVIKLGTADQNKANLEAALSRSITIMNSGMTLTTDQIAEKNLIMLVLQESRRLKIT